MCVCVCGGGGGGVSIAFVLNKVCHNPVFWEEAVPRIDLKKVGRNKGRKSLKLLS